MEQARSALRSMILRLGELAKHGITDPEEIFGPFVELTMEIRLKAREQKHWEYSDKIREGLEGLGIEVRDIPGGSEWISIGNRRKTY
jgi:cysteinyl-tRNA synthetase